MTYLPDSPTPPAIMSRLDRFVDVPRANFAATCLAIAATFEQMAKRSYLDGDDARGDRFWARQLAWEQCARSGDLADVRP